MSDTLRRQQAWSRFWASGATHSCDQSLSLSGTGTLAEFWRGVFSTLPVEARLLDLGTGNGGLVKIAIDAMPAQHDWHLDAVDLAEPRLPWLASNPRADRVRVHPGTAMERLPVADASVSLVMSQFGIEYSTPDESLTECLRVLAADGSIALIVHHADSVITRVSRDEVLAQQDLLSESGLIAVAIDLLPHLAALRGGHAPTPAAEAARSAYNRAMADVAALIDRLHAPDLLLQARESIHALVAQLRPDALEAALQAMYRYQHALEDARIRSEEQIAAALDEAGIHAFLAPLREHLTDLDVQPLRQDGQLLAWAVRGYQPAAPKPI